RTVEAAIQFQQQFFLPAVVDTAKITQCSPVCAVAAYKLVAGGEGGFTKVGVQQPSSFGGLIPVLIAFHVGTSHYFQVVVLDRFHVGSKRFECAALVPGGLIDHAVVSGCGVGAVIQHAATCPEIPGGNITAGMM